MRRKRPARARIGTAWSRSADLTAHTNPVALAPDSRWPAVTALRSVGRPSLLSGVAQSCLCAIRTIALSGYAARVLDGRSEVRIARRAHQAKLVEGEVVETTALQAPVEAFKARRPNKIMEAAETAIGPRERKPRKRKVSPPGV
jgi:hypothetical protein